jgi:hypothetical protein
MEFQVNENLPCWCTAKLARELRQESIEKANHGSHVIRLSVAVREARDMLHVDPSLHECERGA